MESNLFVDPYETPSMPSIVRESLAQDSSKSHVCATITPDRKCMLISGTVMYIWSLDAKKSSLPHAMRMNLPNTGLKYSLDSVCLFAKVGKNLHSLIVVSPEGSLRYWSEIGKPCQDESLLMNSDVVHSLSLINSSDDKHSFLISTTTSSFYVVNIFHGDDETERINVRFVETNHSSGIGKRMSMIFFGNSNIGKDQIVRSIYVSNLLKVSGVDVISVLPKYLRFYSIEKQMLLREIDASEMTMNELRKTIRKSKFAMIFKISIVDATLYQKGLLLLISVHYNLLESKGARSFYLAYLNEDISLTEEIHFKSIMKLHIPDSMATYSDANKVVHVTLHTLNNNECVVIFRKSLITVKNPFSESYEGAYLESFDEFLLGSAVVDMRCHLILKNSGICTLRRLPRLYDLTFWIKFRYELRETISKIDECDTAATLFHKAFINFCSKELDKSSDSLEQAFNHPNFDLSEFTLRLLEALMNRFPYDNEHSHAKLSSGNNGFKFILKQLGNKISYYKMVILFLQYFGFFDKLNKNLNHNGIDCQAIVVEYGQKLISMVFTANSLMKNGYGQSCPLIESALKSHSKEIRKAVKDVELSDLEYTFIQVSMWNKLAPIAIKVVEEVLAECNERGKGKALVEMGELFYSMAEGIMESSKEEWAITLTHEVPTWINQHDFLSCFINFLNKLLQFLEINKEFYNGTEKVLDQILCLANFILSQQNPSQRNNSQIIDKIYSLGYRNFAVELAEKYEDFTLLVKHCYRISDLNKRNSELERYKDKFSKNNFDLFLYEYYRQNGMVNDLLVEKGSRVEDFLASHKNIQWIKKIEKGEYKMALEILKAMSSEEPDSRKKLIELSLCKLCALCENEKDIGEIAELSNSIRALHEPQMSNELQNIKD